MSEVIWPFQVHLTWSLRSSLWFLICSEAPPPGVAAWQVPVGDRTAELEATRRRATVAVVDGLA
jgi:hypothetical protein